jgi:flagellar basal body-associated protein FliL
MYDTATYHKAIDVIAKKKSSKMMWVVWMLVLLALGAAGGAGYFYWTTQ